MKEFLIAIFILLILVAAFSTIESRIEYEYPFGNWAVPGNTGQPVPGEGEPGEVNVFSFGSADQTETQETTASSPITVTVVTEQTGEQPKRRDVLPWVLTGIYTVTLAGVYAFAGYAYAQFFKERKRRNIT